MAIKNDAQPLGAKRTGKGYKHRKIRKTILVNKMWLPAEEGRHVLSEGILGFHESSQEVLACPHFDCASNIVGFRYFGCQFACFGALDLPHLLGA